MPSSERLQDLLDAIAEGDRDALHRFYVLSAPRLYGVTLRILHEPALAEDALVRAYARIWQTAGTFDPRIAEVDRWMVALARQAALEVARARSDLAFDQAVAEREDGGQGTPGAISPELRTLLAGLGELSGDVRRMVLLAYYDGWSREALAVEFDAPVATIRTWLLRSLEQLRLSAPR